MKYLFPLLLLATMLAACSGGDDPPNDSPDADASCWTRTALRVSVIKAPSEQFTLTMSPQPALPFNAFTCNEETGACGRDDLHACTNDFTRIDNSGTYKFALTYRDGKTATYDFDVPPCEGLKQRVLTILIEPSGEAIFEARTTPDSQVCQ